MGACRKSRPPGINHQLSAMPAFAQSHHQVFRSLLVVATDGGFKPGIQVDMGRGAVPTVSPFHPESAQPVKLNSQHDPS